MKKYKIDPGSEVISGSSGKLYVTTTPDYEGPSGIKLKDHDKTYVYKHILLCEQNKLHRYLSKDEDAHHKDENPKNNALSNLEVKTHGEHSRGHALKKKFWKKSPRTKPGQKRKAAQNVISKFRNILLNND